MRPFLDLTGQTFGRLFVLRRAPNKKGTVMFLCQCSCGAIKDIAAGSLKAGTSNSCGCLKREIWQGRLTTHGGSALPEYRVWEAMMRRCYVPKQPFYARYGGRGILVVPRWHHFGQFFADMGPRPSPHHTLERCDNDQGYSPENCRWATQSEQGNNTSKTRKITMDGITQSLSEWADQYGFERSTLAWRLRKWHGDIHRALTTPLRKHKPYRHNSSPS